MRIVSITAELKGQTPLLMHNSRLADPLNEHTKKLAKVTGKRTKTEDDHVLIGRLEWEGGLYFDTTLGPVVPYELVRKSLIEGARMVKLGTHLTEAIASVPDQIEFPVLYKGPREVESMWESGDFTDRRSAGVNKRRITRTRPRFQPWALEAVFLLDTGRLDVEAIAAAGDSAGRFKGLGDGRAIGFGRYNFAVTDVEKVA